MQRNDSRGRLRRWGLPLLVLLLVPAWFGVRWAVRVHVDGRIERMAGQPLPEFRLVGTDGEVYSPEVLRGRTVVLNFFRSRCVSCLAERDAIVELARSAGERVLVLGVMTDAALGFPPEESTRTLERLGYRIRCSWRTASSWMRSTVWHGRTSPR